MNDRKKRKMERDLARLEKSMIEKKVDTTFIEHIENSSKGVVYTIRNAYVGDVEIMESANGWWLDENKMKIIIEGLKEGHDISTVCAYAHVSRSMWQYFNKKHPEFEGIIEMCKNSQIVQAMETINKNLDDPKTARWLLEHKHPDFKTKFTLSDLIGQRLPSMNTNLGVCETGTEEEVAAKLMQVAQSLLADSKARKLGLIKDPNAEQALKNKSA